MVGAGKEAQAVVLVGFPPTFVAVRFVTYSIRAGRYRRVPRNVGTPGGTHLHHLVPGIFLLLAAVSALGILGWGFWADVGRTGGRGAVGGRICDFQGALERPVRVD